MPDLKPRPCPFCGADIKTTGKIMRADGKIVWKHGYVGCAIDGSTIVDVETWNSCPRNERRMIMDINLKKVTKDKLIEMLTEELDEKKRRISELESAVKAGQNRFEYDIRCHKCGCNVPLGGNDTVYRTDEEAKKNATEAWNHRAGEEDKHETD